MYRTLYKTTVLTVRFMIFSPLLYVTDFGLKGLRNALRSLEKVYKAYQSSPSLTISVPLWFIIISLVFYFYSKLLFSGFIQFKGNFVRGQNISKCRDGASLDISAEHSHSNFSWAILSKGERRNEVYPL